MFTGILLFIIIIVIIILYVHNYYTDICKVYYSEISDIDFIDNQLPNKDTV